MDNGYERGDRGGVLMSPLGRGYRHERERMNSWKRARARRGAGVNTGRAQGQGARGAQGDRAQGPQSSRGEAAARVEAKIVAVEELGGVLGFVFHSRGGGFGTAEEGKKEEG
jgi:hypothetical protein